MKTSAGLLMYRIKNKILEVFLIHPGGPYWKNIDSWGIPKGEQDDSNEELLEVAKREFTEETGISIPNGVEFIQLGEVKQKNGKIVHAWGFRNDNVVKFEPQSFVEMMHDDKKIRFPEVDSGRFFNVADARKKIINVHSVHFLFIERLAKDLKIEISQDNKIKQVKLFS
jgi:predicted NUDIX family NTP pyrophosphohydrolase